MSVPCLASKATKGKGKAQEVVSQTGAIIGARSDAGEESVASLMTSKTLQTDKRKGKGKASAVSVILCVTPS